MEERLPRPRSGHGRWTSFVAEAPRGLHEDGNPRHRLRVEHDDDTLLIHLSGEDGDGWTTIAVDRATRRYAVAQERRQSDAAREAYEGLYEP
jgi:hypothetical protein